MSQSSEELAPAADASGAESRGLPRDAGGNEGASDELMNAALRAENEALRAENASLRSGLTLHESHATWPALMSSIFDRRSRLRDVLADVGERLTEEFQVARALVFLWDEAEERLVVQSKVSAGALRLRSGQGLAGAAFAASRTLNVKSGSRDRRHWRALSERLHIDLGASICVPIRSRHGGERGVIQLMNPLDGGYFSPLHERILESVTQLLGTLIDNAELFMREVARNMELHEAQEEVEARASELDRLYQFSRQMVAIDDEAGELRLVSDAALSVAPSDVCVVSLIRDGSPIAFVHGRDQDRADQAWTQRRGAEYHAAVNGCQARRVDSDTGGEDDLLIALGLDKRSHLIVPLHVDDACIGAIELFNRHRPALTVGESTGEQVGGFTNTDVRLLTVIAGQTSGILSANLARRARERSERIAAIGSMVSGVFHDLKTPLTIASGYVQLMERSNDEGARRAFGRSVQHQFDHIQQMVGELIAYARGEHEVYLRNVHVGLFAVELGEWLKQEFVGTNVAVSVQADFVGDARFDEDKLKRILFNLARNAREAMKEGGAYTVRIAREDAQLVFWCRDTGGGIPDELRDRLFEPFVSVGKAKSSGLGLTIVRTLADEMNGSVDFRSERGVGTEFIVRIPWAAVSVDDEDSGSR